MLCPACHSTMEEIEFTADMTEGLTITKWSKCSSCLIACKTKATFFGVKEPREPKE